MTEGTERNPVRVDISNVAHWFFTVNSQEEYDIAKDFPCLASPWPFSEWRWRQPRLMNVNGETMDTGTSGIEFAARVMSLPCDNEGARKNVPLLMLGRAGSGVDKDQESYARHRVNLLSEMEKRDVAGFVSYSLLMTKPIEIFFGVVSIYLDYAGLPVGWPQIFAGAGISTMPRDRGTEAASLAYPVMYATSLLHCKNVELIDKKYSRQVVRQAARRGKKLIKYKELVIEPFKKQVRSEVSGTNESEIHRALHICRGHFATYSEERPLFGKYTGTFWKPMHVRGSKEYGQVKKDYRIDW